MQKDKEEEEKARYAEYMKLPPVPFYRVWAYQRPESAFVVVALIAACASGVLMPCFSLILSRFSSAFFDANPDSVHSNALFYMGMFFLMAGGAFIANFGRIATFGYLGEKLTRRLRTDV
jgi:ATP-binding cassette subfamily B (MDR/TAP) protein 1